MPENEMKPLEITDELERVAMAICYSPKKTPKAELDLRWQKAKPYYMACAEAALSAWNARAPAQPAGGGEGFAIRPLEWSETWPPNDIYPYHHVIADSIFGALRIEWKGWKGSQEPYVVHMNDDYMLVVDTLEDAKAETFKLIETRIRSVVLSPNASARAVLTDTAREGVPEPVHVCKLCGRTTSPNRWCWHCSRDTADPIEYERGWKAAQEACVKAIETFSAEIENNPRLDREIRSGSQISRAYRDGNLEFAEDAVTRLRALAAAPSNVGTGEGA